MEDYLKQIWNDKWAEDEDEQIPINTPFGTKYQMDYTTSEEYDMIRRDEFMKGIVERRG